MWLVGWIILSIVLFCLYILVGLYITGDITKPSLYIFTWIIYTCLCFTLLNIIVLAFFWDDIQKKTGPGGIRGPIGERGNEGIVGTCDVTENKAYLIMSVNKFIDELYKARVGNNILNTETQKFPNTYINNKIATQSGSRQYTILIQTASNYDKTIEDIVNYVKSIWKTWFDLLYSANPAWFLDENGDEEYNWIGENPFLEIRKYDIYYWGISRVFRPLKAEICRSNSSYESVKLPMKPQARLKIIYSNDYEYRADDHKTRGDPDASWWRPKQASIGDDVYYPVGDIITSGDRDYVYWGNFEDKAKTQIGDLIVDTPDKISTYKERSNGPAIKTVLVSGDVKDPIGFQQSVVIGGSQNIKLATPLCPDGYISMGDVISQGNVINPVSSGVKCVPLDCVEQINNTYTTIWKQRVNANVLNHYNWGNYAANSENGYNLFRASSNNYIETPLYKILDKCLLPTSTPSTKEPEPDNAELGIGWYGHPYKLDPQYSIFTFLGLIPEGLIVHKSTGRRYYIIHYGGDEANIYNVLEYNQTTDKFNAGLQSNALTLDIFLSQTTISTNINYGLSVNIKSLSRKDPRQQWIIILQNDKKFLKLKNKENNKYLYIGLDPNTGNAQYSTIDLDNYKNSQLSNIYNQLTDDQINDNTTFTFISAFGTHLDVLDNAI